MREKLTGIPELTSKGKDALRKNPLGLTKLCVFCLASVDGRRDFEQIRSKLRFLTEFDAIFRTLLEGHYIEVINSNKDKLKNIFEYKLGARNAAIFIEQINGLFDRYGEDLVYHLEQVEIMTYLHCKKSDADDLLKALRSLSGKSLVEART